MVIGDNVVVPVADRAVDVGSILTPDRCTFVMMAAICMAVGVNGTGTLMLDLLRAVRRTEHSRVDKAQYHANG